MDVYIRTNPVILLVFIYIHNFIHIDFSHHQIRRLVSLRFKCLTMRETEACPPGQPVCRIFQARALEDKYKASKLGIQPGSLVGMRSLNYTGREE